MGDFKVPPMLCHELYDLLLVGSELQELIGRFTGYQKINCSNEEKKNRYKHGYVLKTNIPKLEKFCNQYLEPRQKLVCML